MGIFTTCKIWLSTPQDEEDRAQLFFHLIAEWKEKSPAILTSRIFVVLSSSEHLTLIELLSKLYLKTFPHSDRTTVVTFPHPETGDLYGDH